MTNIEDGGGSGKIDNTIFISQLDVFFYVADNNIEDRRQEKFDAVQDERTRCHRIRD